MTKPFEKLEEDVSRQIGAKKGIDRRILSGLTAVFVVGVIAVVAGVILLRGSISAETSDTPPIPPSPSVASTSSTPPMPNDPAEGSGKFTFSSLWSMISGLALQNYDVAGIKDAGLVLYSFNDPSYPQRSWMTYPYNKDSSGMDNPIVPAAPLGYYVFNPKGEAVSLTLKPLSTTPVYLYARGWHVLYWPNSAAAKNDLLGQITLIYSDGTKMTAAQAMSSDNHRASVKVFVVIDENSIDLSRAVKELSDVNSDSTVDKIPAQSYFWIYLRRTKDRVTGIEIAGSTVQNEKAKIDAWLKKNNLTECGDAQGTMYAGGNCLFDESTGVLKDKYKYLIEKFPEQPWNS